MGAGAVGGFYGAALAERGHAVTFVARGAHLDALSGRGLAIRSGGRSTVLRPVDAVADPAEAGGPFDLVLFTVKGYDTEPAVLSLRPAVGADDLRSHAPERGRERRPPGRRARGRIASWSGRR